MKANGNPIPRQVCKRALVAAMDAPGCLLANRATRIACTLERVIVSVSAVQAMTSRCEARGIGKQRIGFHACSYDSPACLSPKARVNPNQYIKLSFTQSSGEPDKGCGQALIAKIVELDVLQYTSFFQSLINCASIWRVDERPAGIDPIIDPICVPTGRSAYKFLRK